MKMLKMLTTILAAACFMAPVAKAAGPDPKPNVIKLDDKNTVTLRGEVTSQSTAKAAAEILEKDSSDVYVIINSPGGSVLAGLQLIDLIKGNHKKVHCIAMFAASMAFDLFEECDDRLILENSLLMQHVPSYGVEGNEPNNWSFAQFMHKLHMDMLEKQSARLHLSKDAFYAKVRDDWWLFGDDATKEKAADRKVEATCEPEMTKRRVKETISVLFFTVNVEWSGCPLIAGPTKVDVQMNKGYEGNPQAAAALERLKQELNFSDMISDRKQFKEYIEKINR
jgi:ATP-dependent protease ClpP protease subunit